MYSDLFCKVYNEFGWNYYPEAFAEQLLQWIDANQVTVKATLDLACGTGVLSRILGQHGMEAWGMDFSEGMIRIARQEDPRGHYDVADMTLYRPDKKFDLVTCTGDALNHIDKLADVEKIFQNVYGYLNEDGWFLFDILNEKEVSTSEPFDMPFSEEVSARFQITRPEPGKVNLQTKVFENGVLTVEENIRETIHDVEAVCDLLRQAGFRQVRKDHRLLPEHNEATTWYIQAKK